MSFGHDPRVYSSTDNPGQRESWQFPGQSFRATLLTRRRQRHQESCIAATTEPRRDEISVPRRSRAHRIRRPIDTAPSFAPDIQEYLLRDRTARPATDLWMPASGGDGATHQFRRRLYSTPVWSPRGDVIASPSKAAAVSRLASSPTAPGGSILNEATTMRGRPSRRTSVIMFSSATPGAPPSPARSPSLHRA